MLKRSMFVMVVASLFASTIWGQDAGVSDTSSPTAARLGDLHAVARSIVFPDRSVIATRSLVAAEPQDKSLRDQYGVEVFVLTMDDGEKELQSRFTPRPNAFEELTVEADLKTGTYAVTVRSIDRESLDPKTRAFFQPRSSRVDHPTEKLFEAAQCRNVRLISRDHSGPSAVIRANTAAELDWRFYSNNGFKCLDVLHTSKTCTPAFGMSTTRCAEVTTNNHIDRANYSVFAGYLGTPPGSPEVGIINITEISAVNSHGQVATGSGIHPPTETLLHQQLVQDTMYTCSVPHV